MTDRSQSHVMQVTLRYIIVIITSCAGGRHNMPLPLQVDLKPIDLESGARVTCDVSYLYANFSLFRRPLCSWLRPMYVTDRRQTASLLNAPPRERGHKAIYTAQIHQVANMHLVDSYKMNIFSFCLKMSGECKSASKLVCDVCHINSHCTSHGKLWNVNCWGLWQRLTVSFKTIPARRMLSWN